MWVETDPQGRPVVKGEANLATLRSGLSAMFKNLGADSKLNEGEFTYGLSGTKTRGILFTDEQTRALVKDAVLRFAGLHGRRLGAAIKALPESFVFAVNHADERGTKVNGVEQFLEALDTMTFRSGWSKVS